MHEAARAPAWAVYSRAVPPRRSRLPGHGRARPPLARRQHLNAGKIALFALPGLAFGALLGRMWIVGVPPAAGAITLLIGDSMDPSCTN